MLEFEVHFELLVAACEEILARGTDDPTREEILMEAEVMLREVGNQWPMLTGEEEFYSWAKEEVRVLFHEELREGEIKRGR
jgi:hypothetical protein